MYFSWVRSLKLFFKCFYGVGIVTALLFFLCFLFLDRAQGRKTLTGHECEQKENKRRTEEPSASWEVPRQSIAA